MLTLVVIAAGATLLPSLPLPGVVLIVAGVLALAAGLTALADVKRAAPQPTVGAELTRADHFDLWAVVDATADELGVEHPARIVVDGAARATLVRRPVGNELVIGLPLLLGLSEPELTAVLIEQLALDAAPGAAVHRIGDRIDASLATRDGGLIHRPARALIGAYARVYRRITASANQTHRQRTRDLAVRMTSPAEVDRAAERVALIGECWPVLVTRYVPFSVVAHRRPLLGDGLQNLMLATDPDLGGDDDPPAAELLTHGTADLDALELALLPNDDPAADWTTIAKLAAQAQADERTGHLAWAMRELRGNGRPVTLSAVLDAIADGDGPKIIAPLLRPGLQGPPREAAAQRTLEQLLSAFIITVLLAQGRARHEIVWPDGIRLLRRSGSGWVGWDGDEPIRSGTADPAGMAALRRWLSDIDADLAAEAHPSDGPPLHTLSALSDVDLLLPFEQRRVDLLVYRTGVLLAPIERPTPAARLAQQATATLRRQAPAAAGDRIVQLAEQLGESPQDLPGGWWIPFGTVTSSELRERRGGLQLTLRLDDGAKAMVRVTGRSSVHGSALDDLGRLLPNLTR